MIHYSAIVAIIIAVCTAADNNSIERVDELISVDLYYESLCPYSVRFVVQQLVPAYENMGNYINVTYIPYGKATHEKITNENGTEQWNFTCQHGDDECYGNKAQSCAINEIITNSEIYDQQQVLVNFVGCVMAASNPAVAVPECLDTISITANSISLVNDCIESTYGDELLAANGEKTHALEPTLTVIPTIVLNKVFSQEDHNNAIVDFQSLICQYISVDNQPAVCSGSTLSQTKLNIVAITIFAIFFCVGKETNYFV